MMWMEPEGKIKEKFSRLGRLLFEGIEKAIFHSNVRAIRSSEIQSTNVQKGWKLTEEVRTV